MTKIIVVLAGLYLTYYTFVYAKMTWTTGKKTAGALIGLLAACFPPLSFILYMK
ncbi:hypothetical protein [Paenibacillus aestuarii]|uniref:Uncharacterized protein n=1 Tax=Paenibacillus aestuarii TaxID=516965 RepID=A0ABW0KJC2_9BACL|nr:hypothetical protein [Paenibacillus aestuarii]